MDYFLSVCVDRFTVLEASDTLVFGILIPCIVDAPAIAD
jgi:hypothetical protein